VPVPARPAPAKPAPAKPAPVKPTDLEQPKQSVGPEYSSPRKAPPEFGLDYSNYDELINLGMPVPKGDRRPGMNVNDPNNLAYWTQKYSNVQLLEDADMRQSLVLTKGDSIKLDQRTAQANVLKKMFTRDQKKEFDRILQKNVERILQHFHPPAKDGKKYYGEIRFVMDDTGRIIEADYKILSGHDELDQSMLEALNETVRMDLPVEPLVRQAFVTAPIILNYSDEDMK
jgi:hypothetical protein